MKVIFYGAKIRSQAGVRLTLNDPQYKRYLPGMETATALRDCA